MTKVDHFCWFTFCMKIIHTINYFFSPVFFRGCWSAWWWWWGGWWTWPALDDPTYSLCFSRDSGYLLELFIFYLFFSEIDLAAMLFSRISFTTWWIWNNCIDYDWGVLIYNCIDIYSNVFIQCNHNPPPPWNMNGGIFFIFCCCCNLWYNDELSIPNHKSWVLG